MIIREIILQFRSFWRRNFSRKWVCDIVLYSIGDKIPPMYDETIITHRSTICILDENLYVTLENYNGSLRGNNPTRHQYQLITPRQRKLLIYAHENCEHIVPPTTYEHQEALKEFLFTR